MRLCVAIFVFLCVSLTAHASFRIGRDWTIDVCGNPVGFRELYSGSTVFGKDGWHVVAGHWNVMHVSDAWPIAAVILALLFVVIGCVACISKMRNGTEKTVEPVN